MRMSVTPQRQSSLPCSKCALGQWSRVTHDPRRRPRLRSRVGARQALPGTASSTRANRAELQGGPEAREAKGGLWAGADPEDPAAYRKRTQGVSKLRRAGRARSTCHRGTPPGPSQQYLKHLRRHYADA